MTIDQLRNAVRAPEFRAFTISLADGRRFPVQHPELVSVGREATRTFVVAGKGEEYCIIDLLLVTSLDFGNGNGSLKGTSKKSR